MKREIMEGRSFGKWEVLSYDGCYDHKKSFYLCRCGGCGEIHRVRADRLKAGKSTSALTAPEDRTEKRQPDKSAGCNVNADVFQ